MEFNFEEFCNGLRGLTEEEVATEISKQRQRLSQGLKYGTQPGTEKAYNLDWEKKLREISEKIKPDSKEMFKLDEVLKRD